MKSNLVRMKSQVLFTLTAFTLAIVPVTSTFAILPMASEIFQSESFVTTTYNDEKTLTADDIFSSDNSLIVENHRIIASNDRAMSSNFINEYQYRIELKKQSTSLKYD